MSGTSFANLYGGVPLARSLVITGVDHVLVYEIFIVTIVEIFIVTIIVHV